MGNAYRLKQCGNQEVGKGTDEVDIWRRRPFQVSQGNIPMTDCNPEISPASPKLSREHLTGCKRDARGKRRWWWMVEEPWCSTVLLKMLDSQRGTETIFASQTLSPLRTQGEMWLGQVKGG